MNNDSICKKCLYQWKKRTDSPSKCPQCTCRKWATFSGTPKPYTNKAKPEPKQPKEESKPSPIIERKVIKLE